MFLRIYSNNNKDVLQWIKQAYNVLNDSEKTLLKFVVYSGIRKEEAINSFNLLIDLNKNGKLCEYFNNGVLEHFRYPSLFLRNTKNVYVSYVPIELVNEITKCQKVNYTMFRRHLKRHGLPSRLKEIRRFYSTFMVQHGLLQIECDMIQGRISKSVFVQSYFSLNMENLKVRISKAQDKLKGVIKMSEEEYDELESEEEESEWEDELEDMENF